MVEKDNRNIKFYILVPVYNTEKYIHSCIDSVLCQTYSNYELILVDDGSSDRAGAICDEYGKKDLRIRVIHKSNEGAISARQTAIRCTNGIIDNISSSFFVFLDSDDTLNPQTLSVLTDTIEENGCDLVVYGVQRITEENLVIPSKSQSYTGIITDKRELYKRVFSDTAYNSLCRKAIRCDLMRNEDYSGYFRIKHGEDLLQSISVYKRCKKAVFISDLLYNYTVNPQSMTHSISYQNYPIESTVRAEVWRFLQEEKCFTAADEAEYLQYCCHLLRDKILQICDLQTEVENKMELFDQIRADSYYSMLLNSKHKDLVLNCIKKEDYTRLFGYIRIRSFLRKIYRKLKQAKFVYGAI